MKFIDVIRKEWIGFSISIIVLLFLILILEYVFQLPLERILALLSSEEETKKSIYNCLFEVMKIFTILFTFFVITVFTTFSINLAKKIHLFFTKKN